MIYSLEIEKQVLAAFIQKPKVLVNFIHLISESDFYDGSLLHRTLFSVLKRACEQDESIDDIVLVQRIKDLGLENNLIEHEGLTPGMLVTLGESKILTLNDFADLASDELTGTYDIVNGERIKIKGYLEDFALSKKEADELIMSARNKIFTDWKMRYGKKKIKVINFRNFEKDN